MDPHQIQTEGLISVSDFGIARALSRLSGHADQRLRPHQWTAAVGRLTSTLAEIGAELDVSGERVRQLEVDALRVLGNVLQLEPQLSDFWSHSLSRDAASEKSLLGNLVLDSGDERIIALSRLFFRLLGASHPRRFNGHALEKFWTTKPDLLKSTLRKFASIAPCEADEFLAALENSEFDPDLPVSDLMRDRGSPLTFHSGVWAWVRNGRRDRDAAWLVLRRHGNPLSGSELGRLTKRHQHNLEEAMRRDDRFTKLNSTGLWAVVDWKVPELKYSTTLDAVIGVLGDNGPMPLAQLTRNVANLYPVSPAAVNQCLIHESIGRWPDGRIDLRSRGAPPVQQSEPKRPPSVFLEQGGRVIAVRQDVTPDLLRGSGLGLNRFVSWDLGMQSAPEERTFKSADGSAIHVRRRIHGTNISSLRPYAEALNAQVGCTLIIRLDKLTKSCDVSLGCLGPCVHRQIE
jgi:hypothetical protein